MASRILGLVREQVVAFLFGAGVATDAFNVAFRIPNLLRDLFAEGAMSAAFVPTFTETMSRRGEEEAWRRANLVMNALLVWPKRRSRHSCLDNPSRPCGTYRTACSERP